MYKTKEESMKEDEERSYKERLNYFRKYIIMINMPLLFTFLYEFLGTNLQRSRCQQPITFRNSTLNQDLTRFPGDLYMNVVEYYY